MSIVLRVRPNLEIQCPLSNMVMVKNTGVTGCKLDYLVRADASSPTTSVVAELREVIATMGRSFHRIYEISLAEGWWDRLEAIIRSENEIPEIIFIIECDGTYRLNVYTAREIEKLHLDVNANTITAAECTAIARQLKKIADRLLRMADDDDLMRAEVDIWRLMVGLLLSNRTVLASSQLSPDDIQTILDGARVISSTVEDAEGEEPLPEPLPEPAEPTPLNPTEQKGGGNRKKKKTKTKRRRKTKTKRKINKKRITKKSSRRKRSN